MNQRPLSPHLGVYKFMYTMALSIMHRITGVAASIGLLAFVWWLMALASGPGAYASAMHVLSSPVAKLLLVGFTFSFVYHFCNGIRHLVWDTGRGLTALVLWLGCAALTTPGVP
jgi:succinate dehydrogenase / fumarate reductase cytochrome b subunit